MIETNFDNCVGPLHCFCRTKFFSWDREKALPIDQSEVKKLALCVNTMDEGSEGDKTSRKGGLPTLPGLYHSTIQPSRRGFFRVHMFV